MLLYSTCIASSILTPWYYYNKIGYTSFCTLDIIVIQVMIILVVVPLFWIISLGESSVYDKPPYANQQNLDITAPYNMCRKDRHKLKNKYVTVLVNKCINLWESDKYNKLRYNFKNKSLEYQEYYTTMDLDYIVIGLKIIHKFK